MGRVGGGGQGGCERRIEVFVKIKKTTFGGSGGVGGRGRKGVGCGGRGLRVDVIEELKFLGKFTKKIQGRFGGFGLGGQGGCERRIDFFGGEVWGVG